MGVHAKTTQKTLGLVSGNREVFDCEHLAFGTIQAYCASWGGGVITLKRSNDGLRWLALEYPVTISADGLTEMLDLVAFRYLAAEITTTGAAGAIVTLTFYGMSE